MTMKFQKIKYKKLLMKSKKNNASPIECFQSFFNSDDNFKFNEAQKVSRRDDRGGF